MKKWRIAVGILLVFALGTAIGAYGSRMMFKKRVSNVLQAKASPGFWTMQWMFHRLDLSEAQKTSINAILNESGKSWEAIQQEFEPKIKALFEKAVEDAKKELTPQQREEIEQMSANIRRRFPPRSPSWPKTRETQPLPQPPEPERWEMSSTWIIDRLKTDKEKTAPVQEIIQAGLEKRNELMARFRDEMEPLENKLWKDLADVQSDTEKKLEEILTDGQMQTYRQMTGWDHPRGRIFNFDDYPGAIKKRN